MFVLQEWQVVWHQERLHWLVMGTQQAEGWAVERLKGLGVMVKNLG